MKTPIKRRDLLGLMLSSFVVVACKKKPAIQPQTKPVTPQVPQSPPPTDVNNTGTPPPQTEPEYISPSEEYLAQYTTTELGPKLVDKIPGYETYILSYTDKTSYYPGETMTIYTSAPEKSSKIKIVDANNNVVLTFSPPTFIQYPDNDKPWHKGMNFKPTVTFQIPYDFASGVYKILGRWNTPFIIKNPGAYDITVIYPSNTDNAYNTAGGKSIYSPDMLNRSTVVSFSRFSYSITDNTSPFFDWLKKQPYNVNYISDMDADNYEYFDRSKLVIIAGHSEYWTKQARKNVDKFTASGKNLLVLSGNTMWWQVRYNKPENLMICYKGDASDPLFATPFNTNIWHTSQLEYAINQTIGADFILGGYPYKVTDAKNAYKITNANSPLFEGTGLKNGDFLSLPSMECDGAPVKKMILPDSDEIPEIDNTKLNFNAIELLGYDFAIDGTGKGLMTFIVFKKTKNSGTVVNVASQNWCSSTGIGGKDGQKIATITKNMIDKSLGGKTLFSNHTV